MLGKLIDAWLATMFTVVFGGLYVVLISPIWTDSIWTGVPAWAAALFALIDGPPIVIGLGSIWRVVLEI